MKPPTHKFGRRLFNLGSLQAPESTGGATQVTMKGM